MREQYTLEGEAVFDRKVRTAKGVLEKAVGLSELPLIVNFSGGRDSLTCLILALSVSDDVECLFMDSGQELPQTVPYVEKRCQEFGITLNVSHPQRNPAPHRKIPQHVQLLPDYVKHYGYFPPTNHRYCSIWLKQRPGRQYLRKKFGRGTICKVVGVRKSESSVRMYKYGSRATIRKYGGYEIRPDNEHRGAFLVYPILDWTRKDVTRFLELNHVEIHEGYKLFGMSGCKWCPIARPENVRKISEVCPHLYDDLLEAEAAIDKPAWLQKRIWLRDVVKA